MKIIPFISLVALINSIYTPTSFASKGQKAAPPPTLEQAYGFTKEYTHAVIEQSPNPFTLQLGSTNLAAAQTILQQEGAAIDKIYYANHAQYKQVEDKELQILEFSNLPIENFKQGRLSFYQNKLYLIYYEFINEQSAELIESNLVSKYGKPHKISGFPDRIVEWRFKDALMLLRDNFTATDRLMFTHNSLLKQVQQKRQPIKNNTHKTDSNFNLQNNSDTSKQNLRGF